MMQSEPDQADANHRMVIHTAREAVEFFKNAVPPPQLRLGEYLVERGLVAPDKLEAALKLQDLGHKQRLGEIFVEFGLVTPENLAAAEAARLGLPDVALEDFEFDQEAVAALPAHLARALQVMPVCLLGEDLLVAIASLPTPEKLEALRFAAQRQIRLAYSNPAAILAAQDREYRQLAEDDAIREAESDLGSSAADDERRLREAEQQAHERPIVKLVDAIIEDAVHQRASDIHLVPFRRHFAVQYRIDGSLVKVREVAISLLAPVVNRIKILARLDIAERRLAQDGRFRLSVAGSSVDFRVSVIPVVHGESIVIRVLNRQQSLRRIEQIGFAPGDEQRFRRLMERSHGIFLVTGPTGSGKTTTLYAALQNLKPLDLNIITVEDPVEYELPGMRQIQLTQAIDFGFAQTIRHILRHDPDVIMVGEMRDRETCSVAVEAALTGHLVLSTLHANDAPSTITRLIEIGIPPYLIRSTLIGVLAQRLVRLNCPHCLVPETIDAPLAEAFGLDAAEAFWRGAGCERCNHTGLRGRKGLFELLVINDTMEAAISHELSARALRELAIDSGMLPLVAMGLAAARKREVSLAEVYRSCL